MRSIDRRQFIKHSTGGIAALVVGSGVPWVFTDKAYAAKKATVITFTITDALKDMATHNLINQAQCYFWIYKEAGLPAEAPGPHIFVTQGENVEFSITNELDEPHVLSIPALEFTSGPIEPGATVTASFVPAKSGTYLYYDDLNEPVNRVMGLHGAFIVMPAKPSGAKFTPYDDPTPIIQKLFDDLGQTPWWPGLSWEEGDPFTNTPAFRQYIWLLHQASPNLFAEVGDFTPGLDYPADQFVQKFLHDPFSPTNANAIPQYFTINGQAGHFSHNTPYINPNVRVGEPVLIRILNPGLWTHSLHLHANHFYVLNVANAAKSSLPPADGPPPPSPGDIGDPTGTDPPADNGGTPAGGSSSSGACFISSLEERGSRAFTHFPDGPQENLIWLDVYTAEPMDVIDYLIPYMRPPDIPNARGVGRADPGLATLTGGATWPPNEELATIIPLGLAGSDLAGNVVDLSVTLSVLCYPMHDHSEPTQTSQGGNYNMGMIAGVNFIGDRNTPGGVTNFPHQPLIGPAGPKGLFTPAVNPPWFVK